MRGGAGRGPAGSPPASEAALRTLLDLPEVVIYPAGCFVPASTGEPFPDGYRRAVVAGGAAGNITVTGIRTADEIQSVTMFDTGVPSDLTAEFAITALNTVNNADGTDTTGNVLIVEWHRRGYDLTGLAFDNVTEEKAAMPLFAPASWSSVNVNLYGLASAFGTGDVRFHDAASSTTVTTTITAGGVVTFPNLAFADSTVAALGKFHQFALIRKAEAAEDTLAERFCVLAVYLTPGA